MNSQEKAVARKFFKSKILEADGQAFEDLFVRIMSLAVPGFKPIRPHGSIGDRKNDGYVEATGTYYQVFAPEDLTKSHAKATVKLKTDLDGLLKAWPSVQNFFFVLNDKYKGPYPDAAQHISALRKEYQLVESDIMLAKDLEDLAFTKLPDDALIELVNFPPDPSTLPHLDFGVLGEVIAHIMRNPSLPKEDEELVVPDWDRKLEINGLSKVNKQYIEAAARKMGYLKDYLANQGEFASQELRNRMVAIYEKAKNSVPENERPDGDIVFARMLELGVPTKQSPFQDAFMVVFAKYFETCDVFEEPEDE